MDQAQRRVGTRFAGRYDLTAVLGEGGMGAVYRARHAFTGTDVALKIMHSGVARSTNARERFLREAQAPSAIGHPGIVKVTDAGVAEDGTLYLALELLDGEDLGAAVERGRVDAAAVVAVTIDVLDTLGAAHASGLVHRDIKPENIFLCRDAERGRRVRLLDFGITRQVSETEDKLTQTGTILGTPHYMSPEQARGQVVDARSDLYAIGGMMFYALTGRPPFNAANYNLLIVAIMTHPAPPLRSVRPEIPPDVAGVVDRALSMSPDDRFASASEMRAALEACATPRIAAASAMHAVAYEPTLPSDVGLPAAQPATPIHHSVPAVAPGVETQPEAARTPPSAAPARGGIPATMASSAVGVPAAAAVSAEHPAKESKKGLAVTLAVLLLAVFGGGAVAYLLIPSNGADDEPIVETPPPAVVTEGPTIDPDEAMVPNMDESSVEQRIAELEERTREAEERAAEAEREQQEEEEARAVAARRAAMRRAQERAAEEAAQRREHTQCRVDCSQQLARCRRESGGQGTAASNCHLDWSRCLRGCDRNR